MEKVYKLNKKRMILYLLVFLLTSGMVTYMSIEDTMKYKKVLEKYDDKIRQGNLDIDTVNILEKMSYDRDNERYSLRLIRTIIICVIVIILFNLYFLKNSKIVIDEEGIKVYSLYKRKAHDVYPWHSIHQIQFHYGEGIRGLISEYGMKISKMKDEKNTEEIFVPIQRLLNYNEISEVLIANSPHIEIEAFQNIKKDSHSLIQLLKEAYIEYKSDFRGYLLYSFIIFIFALLNTLLNNTPVNLIVVGVSIYFGYRAKIAINYKAYMSYRGEKIDFDRGWDYAKSKLSRYFGANVIIGTIVIVFMGIEYFCLISELGRNYEIVLSVILGIGYLLSIGRIYLISYIASIVDKNISYMSLNGMLIRKCYKEIALVIIFLSLQLAPMIIIGILYYKDLYTVKNLLAKATYINIIVELFVSPYVSCFIMKFLKELPVSREGNYNE